MKVKKGESIKLNLIINNGNEENNFEIAANQAVNNNNFTLDYSLSDEKVEQYLAEKEPTFNFYKDIFFEKEAKDIFSDCDEYEVRFLVDLMKSAKIAFRKDKDIRNQFQK